MGIYLNLDVDDEGIDPAAWKDCFDDTLRLLRAHPSHLLGYDAVEMFGTRVPVYTRDIERDHGGGERWRWCVVGDRQSMRCGETQELPRELRAGGRKGRRPDRDDILWYAAKNEGCGPVRLLGNKTQGYPYHHPVLAAAMVVESRFPRHAMVHGDIDKDQALRAQKWAQDTLGHPVALPVRVDAPELIGRLSPKYSGVALVEAFASLHLAETVPEQIEATLKAFPGEVAEEWWVRELRNATAGSVGEGWHVIAWLNATGDLRRVCELACLDERGPRREPKRFAKLLADAWSGLSRESTSFTDVLRTPPGEAPTIASALGSSLLDMEAFGRHLDVRFDAAAVEECLRQVVGPKAGAAIEVFRKRTAEIEADLVEPRANFAKLAAHIERDPWQEVEDLAVIESADELLPEWRDQVHALAVYVRELPKLATGKLPKGFEEVFAPVSCRRMIASILRYGPVITEDAWERIRDEGDEYALQFMLGLAMTADRELQLRELCRVILENGVLLRYAIEVSKDEKLMKAARKLIEGAHKRRRK